MTKLSMSEEEMLKRKYTRPYEKKIEELEKGNVELKAELTKKADTNHSLVEQMADLEKKNAELKGIKDVATLIRANNDTVVTLMQLNNKLVSKSQQLAKATEIIKQLLGCLKQDANDPETNYYICQYMDKAEQFLNSENIILEDAQAGNSPFDADEVFNKEMKAYPNRKVK